jgi:hypothetical protein
MLQVFKTIGRVAGTLEPVLVYRGAPGFSQESKGTK